MRSRPRCAMAPPPPGVSSTVATEVLTTKGPTSSPGMASTSLSPSIDNVTVPPIAGSAPDSTAARMFGSCYTTAAGRSWSSPTPSSRSNPLV